MIFPLGLIMKRFGPMKTANCGNWRLPSIPTAEYISEKYAIVPLSSDDPELCANWTEYVRKVRELIARKLPETEFIQEIQQLDSKTPFIEY